MSQGAYKNLIEFGSTQLYVDRSRDGSTLTFTIPEHLGSCDGTNCPLINTTPRVYNIFVRNGEGLSSDAIPFTVTSTTTIPTTTPPVPTTTTPTTPSVPTTPTPTPTTPSPQAHISVGGSNNATAKVGDRVTYAWSAMDATSATSTYTASPSRCGAGGAWLANTTSGSLTSDPLPASYAGCTFTIKYKSKNTAGTTAEDTLVLTIQ